MYLPSVNATIYLESADFISASFEGKPKIRSLWIKDAQQVIAREILGHNYKGIRVRYWQLGTKTAWVLDEIGKEKPITVGIVIDKNHIEKITILAFRESRGSEVRHPFFTQQFIDTFSLDGWRLSNNIDGIAGATLSVRAVSKLSRYALYLQSLVGT